MSVVNKPRLNHQIRSLEVRVIDPQLGIITHSQAMAEAGELGLDLIEIASDAQPPVCIIKDLGKWKYEQAKKQKEQRQPVFETKQIQLRPVTELNDLMVKSRQITKFIEDGHRVRLVVRFRGRELAHPGEGEATLQRLVELCGAGCEVESKAGLDGKQITWTLKKR
jgi:translation initiation factor IF-3